MAKHRTPKKRRARKAALAGVAAAGLSTALVLGQSATSTVMLDLAANTVITAGGLFDTKGERVQNKLRGTVIPEDYDSVGVLYPATTNLSGSRDAGAIALNDLILLHAADQSIIVASYSEGTLVAEKQKRNLQMLTEGFPDPNQLSFVSIASPFAGNGGIFARFPGVGIPGVVDPMGPAVPSRYATTYHTNQYDTYGDFPAYFNPLALLNAALGIRYTHPDPAYDPLSPNAPRYVTTVPKGGGNTETYILYYTKQLPLLGPLRDIAAFTGTTAFTEPFLSAIEPLLRVLVDMAYTDRVNAKPNAVTPFSFITPLDKFVEALNAVPGALNQGLQNFLSGGHAVTAIPNPIGNLQMGPTPVTTIPQENASRLSIASATSASLESDDADQPLTLGSTTPAATPPPSSPAPTSASPTFAAPTPSAPTVTQSATPTQTTTADAGVRPTLTSDGNKFTPGDVVTSTTTTDTTTPATTTTTTTTSTSTTTTGTTATTATPGSPTDDSTNTNTADTHDQAAAA